MYNHILNFETHSFVPISNGTRLPENENKFVLFLVRFIFFSYEKFTMLFLIQFTFIIF